MTNCIELNGLVKEYKTFTLGPVDLKEIGRASCRERV